MREEIKKAITDLIYTADAKPRTTFTDGSPLETKLQLIDEAVNKVLNVINSQPKKYCYWSIADAEQTFNQMKEDEGMFPDVEYTDSLGEEIMDLVEDRFDANYGVTWDDIRDAILTLLQDENNQ